MRYVALAGDELVVSVLGLGCGNFGGVGSAPELFGRGDDERAAGVLLDAAVERGITLLDTANSYGGGRSEEWIGRWLAGRGVRDELVITTKVGNPVGPGESDRGLSAGHIRAQVEGSLRRLRTDRIDLYLTHAPDPGTPLEETLGAFDGLVRAGKIRWYGLSNVDGGEVERAVAVAERDGLHRPVNLQIGHSVLEPADADTLDACVRRGVAVTAYSPLAGGWLARDYRPGEPYPVGSRMTLRPEPYRDIERRVAGGAMDTVRAEAKRRGVSLPTLALAWVLGEPAVAAAIVGARTPEHLVPALGALELELTDAERAAIMNR
ncbi:MAG TPA: aldo/keto reductase [Actinophytocola sp.]|uniref:aldo/keto reductase n=1 Tax=Actinophytocola sp. TaxID=1872138 RepID=UPI002DDCE179|nr:aldo/keto reductase [Actinophytocola sp.]HEV2778338.1 aldo/keto reductase [Actinophytocola sp.]